MRSDYGKIHYFIDIFKDKNLTVLYYSYIINFDIFLVNIHERRYIQYNVDNCIGTEFII